MPDEPGRREQARQAVQRGRERVQEGAERVQAGADRVRAGAERARGAVQEGRERAEGARESVEDAGGRETVGRAKEVARQAVAGGDGSTPPSGQRTPPAGQAQQRPSGEVPPDQAPRGDNRPTMMSIREFEAVFGTGHVERAGAPPDRGPPSIAEFEQDFLGGARQGEMDAIERQMASGNIERGLFDDLL